MTKYILAYEIANFKYSAALLKFDMTDTIAEVLAFEEMLDSQTNIAKFIPFINRLLDQTQLNYQDINFVALTTGPGSFTGIRMGIAFARGLRLCTNAQFIGISSFEITAAAVIHENSNSWPILTVLESRRADKYFQLYDAHLEVLKPGICLLPHEYADYLINNILITGNGKGAVDTTEFEAVHSSSTIFDACHVGQHAATIIQSNRIDHYPLIPFYLHAASSFNTSTQS